MSNEQFFLQLAEKGYFRFVSIDPEQSKNGIKSYIFNFYNLDPQGGESTVTAVGKVRFNQIGGLIDIKEIK